MAAVGLPTYTKAWSGAEALVPWVALRHVDDQNTTHVYRYSTLPLGDPLTFHGGRKEARLLSASWMRVTSDTLGAPQVGTFTFTLDDTDQVISRWLGNTYQSKLRGIVVELLLCARTDWIAKESGGPTVVWTGLLDTVDPSSSEQSVTITASGALAQLLDKSWPDTVVDTTHFPSALPTALGKVEPIVMGTWEANDPVAGGEWPVLYLGEPYTISGNPGWRKMLVCRHEITSIDSLWLDGVDITSGIGVSNDFLVPGYTAWPEANDYVDLAGRRYTLIYVIGATAAALEAGTSRVTVALTNGMSPGFGYLAYTAAGQLAWFLDNFVFGHMETTAISVSSNVLPNGSQKRETAVNDTWPAASTAGSSILTAWGLTEPMTLRDILAGVCLSGDLRLAENAAGSLCCWEGDDSPDVRSTHVDRHEMIAGSLQVRQRAVENIHGYSYGRSMVGGDALGTLLEVRDATSIARHGELPAQAVDLWAIRDSTTAAAIATRRLTRAKAPRTDLSVGLSAAWLFDSFVKDQVGCHTLITHRSAPGGIVGYGDYLVSLSPSRFWRLGEQPEQSPTVAKDYTGSTDGTYAGSPQLGIIKPTDDGSTGLKADGSNDKVTFSSITLNSTITWSFWICPDSSQSETYGAIFSLVPATPVGIYYKNTGKISVFFGGADHLNSTTLQDGVWYHVVISISAGSGTFYLNGVADGTFSSYAGYNCVGLLSDNASNHWLKAFGVADLALWNNVALSSTQAATLYARRVSDRSAQGITDAIYMLERASFDLATLVTTYDLQEYVNV